MGFGLERMMSDIPDINSGRLRRSKAHSRKGKEPDLLACTTPPREHKRQTNAL